MGEDTLSNARILLSPRSTTSHRAGPYKTRWSAAAAEAELREVAGRRVDGRLVWLFVTQVLRGVVLSTTPAATADLETELQVQRRMRGVLDQALVLGPPTA